MARAVAAAEAEEVELRIEAVSSVAVQLSVRECFPRREAPSLSPPPTSTTGPRHIRRMRTDQRNSSSADARLTSEALAELQELGLVVPATIPLASALRLEVEDQPERGAAAASSSAAAAPAAGSPVVLVVINCGDQDGGQSSANNSRIQPKVVFEQAMPAFHAAAGMDAGTRAVFLVAEPKWAFGAKGALRHLTPCSAGDGVASLGDPVRRKGGAAVVWGAALRDSAGQRQESRVDLAQDLAELEDDDDRGFARRLNALLEHFAVARLLLPLAESAGETSPCLFLSYHGPWHKLEGMAKEGWVADIFRVGWELARRHRAPLALGGDFNAGHAVLDRVFKQAGFLPDGARFEAVEYELTPRRAGKEKIDHLFLLTPAGCETRLELEAEATVAIDPAAAFRKIAAVREIEVHPNFFDHDAVCARVQLRSAEPVVSGVTEVTGLEELDEEDDELEVEEHTLADGKKILKAEDGTIYDP